ncbi:cytochrome P450 [Thermoplasmatales archaeon SW_10_69_26]|nr:MAG: cytochrome P450 [Thermoplasmatales archaeon SW_10_69_26]
MPSIPTTILPDSTLSLMRKPYDFIREECQRQGADLFATRLMLEPTICVTGPEAAELFYDEDRFRRYGAAPVRVQKTLFGDEGIQSLDGQAHRHRKRMLMDLTTPERARDLAVRFRQLWRSTVPRWASADRVVLYDEVRELITRSVLPWAGIPVDEDEIPTRTRQLSSLFETAGAVGPKHWKGRMDRWQADRWAGDLIQSVRDGEIDPPEGSPLHEVAWHHDLAERLLDPREAGVELLNLLRPTVAVGVYITFVAHALHQHPTWDDDIDDERASRWFAEEVRRHYPFFPVVAARTRRSFTWKGYRFPADRRVLLDVDGTNHDLRVWEDPHEFRPERFREADHGPYGFIPQGGGDPETGHRCPGEDITLALTETALDCLQQTSYGVPAQDQAIDRSRLPALPSEGFVIDDVEPQPEIEAAIEPPEQRRTAP